jgi:hypothetical protein
MITISEPLFGIDGAPISRGVLYLGTAGAADPQTDPVAVYWDNAGTQAATQPIEIRAGRARRDGQPAQIYTDADYSMQLIDRTGAQVYYRPNSPISLAIGADSQPLSPVLTALAGITPNSTPIVPAIAFDGTDTFLDELVVGTDLQAWHSALDALAAVTDAADVAGPVDPDTELPTRIGGHLYREAADGAWSFQQNLLAGVAYQTWVDERIAAAIPTDTGQALSLADLEEQFWQVEEFGAIGQPLARAETLADVSAATGARWLQFRCYSDFPQNAGSFAPFAFTAINNGTTVGIDAVAGHNGMFDILSSDTLADGGGRIGAARNSCVLRAGSYGEIIFSPQSVADETYYLGFCFANSVTAPTDSVMFSMAPGGILTPTMRADSGTAVTGTTNTLVVGTFYRIIVEILSTTAARLILKNADTDATLRDVTLTGTVPTSFVGFQAVATSTYWNATRRSLIRIDDIGVRS